MQPMLRWGCLLQRRGPALRSRARSLSIQPLLLMAVRADQAFLRQVDTYEDRIRRIARSYLNDDAEAQDVTQEVLVKLWEHQEDLDEDRLTAWLSTVTRNACIDILRARQRRRKTVRKDPEGVERAASSDRLPDRHAETADLHGHVLDALDRVDDPYRRVVALRELQGLKYKEIATALDMPINTVKVYLHRGRKKLQTEIDRSLDPALA